MQALVAEEALASASATAGMWSVSTTATAAALCAALALGSWIVVERVCCSHGHAPPHPDDDDDENNNGKKKRRVSSALGAIQASQSQPENLCYLAAKTSSPSSTLIDAQIGSIGSRKGSKKRRKSATCATIVSVKVAPQNSATVEEVQTIQTELSTSESLLATPNCRQFVKLGLNSAEIYFLLDDYKLSGHDLRQLGFPVESQLRPGQAYFYHSPYFNHFESGDEIKEKPHQMQAKPIVPVKKQLSANAQVFVPGKVSSNEQHRVVSRRCIRCGKSFLMTTNNTYVRPVEACQYHWGKLRPRRPKNARSASYTCCQSTKHGCSWAKQHVWSGVEGGGLHGPFGDYVKTRKSDEEKRSVFAMDGEMVFTARGLDLVKVSLVALDGQKVYDALVKPDLPVVDYNTRFSGMTAADMNVSSVKSLEVVREELLKIIDQDCLLIGHGLENDLRALKIIHHNVIDTAVVFPHFYGLPYRRSLKSLTRFYLKREIQLKGHDSYEDALACVELMLWKIRKDSHESARRP